MTVKTITEFKHSRHVYVKLLIICYIVFAVKIYGIGGRSKSNSSVKLKLSACVQKFVIRNQNSFGYPIKMETLMCRCDCSKNRAAQLLYEASGEHVTKCITKERPCFVKFQDEMDIDNCHEEGYSYCLIKLSTTDQYKVLNIQIIDNYYRIILNDGEIIDVPLEVPKIIHKGKVYRILKDGVKCQRDYTAKRYFLKEESPQLGKIDVWQYDDSDYAKEFDLSRPDWFVQSNMHKHFNKLVDYIEYTDNICGLDANLDASFTAPGWQMNKTSKLYLHKNFGRKLSGDRTDFDLKNSEIVNKAPVTLVESYNGLYFDGKIVYGDDGYQYLILSNTHFNGVIRITTPDDNEQIVIPHYNYIRLSKKYTNSQWICLEPEGLEELKTCRLVNINYETIFALPTTTAIVSLTKENILTTEINDISTEKTLTEYKNNFNLLLGFLLIFAILSIILLTLLIYKYTKKTTESEYYYPERKL